MRNSQSPDNNDSNNENDEYKICAGKGCNNIGIHLRKIIYFNKTAYFCDKCIDDLDQSGLLINT